jgi:hypothetical protein
MRDDIKSIQSWLKRRNVAVDRDGIRDKITSMGLVPDTLTPEQITEVRESFLPQFSLTVTPKSSEIIEQTETIEEVLETPQEVSLALPSHKEVRSLVFAEAEKMSLTLKSSEVLDITDAIAEVDDFTNKTIRNQIEKYLIAQSDLIVNDEIKFINDLVAYRQQKVEEAEKVLISGVSGLMRDTNARRTEFNKSLSKLFDNATEEMLKKHSNE